MTKWLPDLSRSSGPLFLALAEAIERDVYAGVLVPGQRLPTHRELADQLGINVSTVTRGYAEAERRGLAAATTGRGTFVAADATTNAAMVSFEPRAPGLIEMGLIEPLYGLDPDMSESLRRLSRRRNCDVFLRYGDPRGLPEHRRAGAAWAARYGLEVSPERVLVCSGAQHALTCCLAGLMRPGERLAADRLSYPGLKTLAAMLGLRLAPVDRDERGLTPESLDAVCRREAVRALYLNPGAHNPTMARMSLARREAVAAVARRHDLLVVEDDAYDLTAPGREPPVARLAPERVLHVAGMSKCLAAGLRTAFLIAPEPLVAPLARAALNTVWMTPPLCVELAAMWIEDGTADRTAAAKRREAGRRFALARRILGELAFAGQPTGFFLWLSLPEPLTGAGFEAACRRDGVNVFGAERFVTGEGPAPRAARISLVGPPDLAELERGLHVIAALSGRRDRPDDARAP